MASRNGFGEKFHALLQEIPADYSLQEWQHMYSQALLGMGLTILEKFPGEIIGGSPGPNPHSPTKTPPPAWAAGGSGGAGYNPQYVSAGGCGCGLSDFVRFVLHPLPPQKQKSRKKRR